MSTKNHRKTYRPLLFLVLAGLEGCSTLPEVQHEHFEFPKNAYFSPPSRAFEIIGVVKSRVDYATLDPNHEESQLCQNYFNRAVEKLIKYSRDKGGDAVINVHSVVFLLDGRKEAFPRAECSDEGAEGQVLAEGQAIKWLKTKKNL